MFHLIRCLHPSTRRVLLPPQLAFVASARTCTAGSTFDADNDLFAALHPNVTPARKQRRPRQTSPKADISIAEDVRRHFCTPELDAILRSFPVKFMRRKYRYPEHFYIADPLAAEQLADLLLADHDADQPLVEVNPGPGLLTQRLAASGRVRDLRLFEANREFMPALNARFVANAADDRHPHMRTTLRAGDMLNLYRMSYQDKMDKGDRIERFLAGLPRRDWTDGPNVRLFACVGSVNFFKHMISSTVLQNDLLAFGRPDMLLVLPPPLYVHLTCDSRAGLMLYRSTSMLFQIMFTHEFVGRVPRQYFLPYQFKQPLLKYKRIEAALSYEPDSMYVVRVRPRANLYDVVDADQIQALWYFIKQNCISRSKCVIPNLEKLIPSAGAHLILDRSGAGEPVRPLPDIRVRSDAPASCNPSTTMTRNDRFVDMNIFTTFGDLSPSQMLALFHQFVSWPGYESSAFRQGLEDSLQKMELTSAGIEDVLSEGADSGGVEAQQSTVAAGNRIGEVTRTAKLVR